MISNEAFCADLRQRIVQAYARSGNEMGWRLLASPAQVLDGAEVAFIGLNPGGNYQPADHGEFCMSAGSAYVVETWGASSNAGESPLQIQVRSLFKRLCVEPDQVLAGNLVPFRSPSWSRLARPDFSLSFGEEIWAEILQRACPKLIIGMGHETFDPLSRIVRVSAEKRVSVGWGKVSAKSASFEGGKLVVLPHLSRFSIITRALSAEALAALFD